MRRVALWVGIGLASGSAVAQDPSTACLEQLRTDSRYLPVAEKVPFDVTKGQPLELLASAERPTAAEKAALSFLATEGERCYELGDRWRTENYGAEINGYMLAYRVDLVSAMADLYAGKLTFGDLAKFRAKQMTDLKVKIDSAVARARTARESREAERQAAASRRRDEEARAQQAQEVQMRQFEESRRQAALMMLLNRPQPQAPQLKPYIMPTPAPRTSTNCTSYLSGNQLHTNCN